MEEQFNLDHISHPIDEVNEFNVDDWGDAQETNIDWLEPTDLSDNDLYRGTVE